MLIRFQAASPARQIAAKQAEKAKVAEAASEAARFPMHMSYGLAAEIPQTLLSCSTLYMPSKRS